MTNELTLQVATGREEESSRREALGQVPIRRDAILRLGRETEVGPNRYRFDGLLLFSR